MDVLHRYIRHIRSIRAAVLFLILLLGIWIAASACPELEAQISLQRLVQSIQTQGLVLTATPSETTYDAPSASTSAPLQPSTPSDPSLRGVKPLRYAIGADGEAAAAQPIEALTLYVFPTITERTKGEDELLRMIRYHDGPLVPALYKRGNVLMLYWPSAIVNQSGTKFGDRLQQALDRLQ